MSPGSYQEEPPLATSDSESYCASLMAFFQEAMNPTHGQWRVDLFVEFWRRPNCPIGIIQATKSDPNDTAEIFARRVLEEKLGKPRIRGDPNPNYSVPSRYPLIHVAWESPQKSPEHNFAFMVGTAWNAISHVLGGTALPLYDGVTLRPETYWTKRLTRLKYALERMQGVKFPYEDDEKKMVCLIVGIDLVTTNTTVSAVREFVRLLEDIFVTKGKGKLVFIGDASCEAVKCLRNADKVVKIYEDDGSEYRDPGGAWARVAA